MITVFVDCIAFLSLSLYLSHVVFFEVYQPPCSGPAGLSAKRCQVLFGLSVCIKDSVIVEVAELTRAGRS